MIMELIGFKQNLNIMKNYYFFSMGNWIEQYRAVLGLFYLQAEVFYCRSQIYRWNLYVQLTIIVPIANFFHVALFVNSKFILSISTTSFIL